MKSAYELAMERLNATEPKSRSLTKEQKTLLSEIESRYKAKIAEREIFLRKALAEAEAASQFDDVEKIRAQIANERLRLEDERETEKDKIRSQS